MGLDVQRRASGPGLVPGAKVVAKHVHRDGRIVLGCEIRFGPHSATYHRNYLWGEDCVLGASPGPPPQPAPAAGAACRGGCRSSRSW